MKFKDIKQLSEADRNKKLKELKMELVKSKVSASKTGTSKSKNVRKIIARILTLNNQLNKGVEKKK